MTWLGLDIGGANLKAATLDGQSKSTRFPFWRRKNEFESELTALIRSFPNTTEVKIAATMTAELADCFDSRKSGVHFIVDSVSNVCRNLHLEAPIFATTSCSLLQAGEAKSNWQGTAAANWAMLARFASRFLPNQSGVVIDVGSTTTDIIPVNSGFPATLGKTDSARLQHGELVYAGVDRTPVCGVINAFRHGNCKIPIAREHFATVADAMLLRGHLNEDPLNVSTADGKPMTAANASARICRMTCQDASEVPREHIIDFAHQIIKSLETIILAGMDQVFARSSPKCAIVTGSGHRFARNIMLASYPDINLLNERSLPNEVAPAYAVAVLASEFMAVES